MSVTHKTGTVHFTVKGQIVIPRWLREKFEIEKGTRALVYPTPEGILLKPITATHFKSLRGSLKGRGVLKSMMAERKREREL